jgi:DNA repair protein RecO (recombination protein O)
MKWEDEGIVLSVKPFGEKGYLVCLITKDHGRVMGWLKSASTRIKAVLQPGIRVQAHWQARLEEQLGGWRLEPLGGSVAALFTKPLSLSALLSATALCEVMLPEREPHGSVYASLLALIKTLGEEAWERGYFDFECALLAAAGFRLHLSSCAVTGARENLFYVSPRSGKAVCQAEGVLYHDKLLMFPSFLQEDRAPCPKDLLGGLDLTEYFIERYILPHGGYGLPAARTRLKEDLRQRHM